MDGVVGIDYLPAVAHAPGVGRYARELVRALAPIETRPELRLFDVGGGERAMGEPDLGIAGAARLRHRQRRWPRRVVAALARVGLGADRLLGGVDLFHRILPGHPPVSRAPQVLPVAELPPPGSTADQELGDACRAAAAVVVFSSAYRDEVPRRYDLDPASVWITPVGCEHWTRKLPDPPPRPTPPHLLVLGAIRRPRRPLAVLEAFACLRDGGVEARLTFVGHPGDAAEAFRPALDAHAHRAAITWIERPIEKDMPGLAAGATLLVHLAEDEGSPVTPLELFAYGRGVVAAELPAYREALGDLAVHVPQDASPRELSDAIAGALVEPTVADGERVAVAAGYRWDTTARRTLEVWQHVFEASKNARR